MVRAGVNHLRGQILRCDSLSPMAKSKSPPRGRIKLQKTPEGHQSIFFLKSMLIAFGGYCQSKNCSRGTRSYYLSPTCYKLLAISLCPKIYCPKEPAPGSRVIPRIRMSRQSQCHSRKGLQFANQETRLLAVVRCKAHDQRSEVSVSPCWLV